MNQNVDVLGRRFHVQTEVIAGERARISTTVFIAGRVVAKREVALDPVALSDEEIRDQLTHHHSMIVDNLLTRATALSAGRVPAAPRPERRPLRPSVLTRPLGPPARPAPTADAKLEASLNVRRLLARFRQFIVAVRTPLSEAGILQRLRAAHEVVAAIMANPVFPDIRLDEQVRFFDLAERLPAVLVAPEGREAAAQLWAEVVEFAGYLSGINQRCELMDFDRRALNWAVHEIAANGVSDDVLELLSWSYGLDFELDQLVDHPRRASAEEWRDRLFVLLDELGTGEL